MCVCVYLHVSLLYVRSKRQRYPLNPWPDGPQVSSDGRFAEQKDILLPHGIEPQFVVVQPVALYKHILLLLFSVMEATSSALCFQAFLFSSERETDIVVRILWLESRSLWSDCCGTASMKLVRICSPYTVRVRFWSRVRWSSKESFSHSFSQSLFHFKIVAVMRVLQKILHKIFTYPLENIVHYYTFFICKRFSFFTLSDLWLWSFAIFLSYSRFIS